MPQKTYTNQGVTMPDRRDDLSNKTIFKWLSVDTVIMLVSFTFLTGAAYRDLVAADTLINVKVEELEQVQTELAKSVSAIDKNVAVIQEQQKNMKEHLEVNLKRQNENMNKVLQILEDRR